MKRYAIAYLLIAVLTSGHASLRIQPITNESGRAPMILGPIVSVVWPLYWSYQLNKWIAGPAGKDCE